MALVHDWLTGMRGGERVLHELASIWPDADLYTLVHVPGATSERIDALRIRASPLSGLPGIARHYRKLLPLFPLAIERFHLRGYDLVLSTSHAFAKGVRSGDSPHLCYCFTPMRWVWDQADAYLGTGAFRRLAAPLASYLRGWDRRTAAPERIDRFVAISREVSGRIRRHYGRTADVIWPPVDTERIRPSGSAPDDFFLLVGGFVPYKREEMALRAFEELGLPLVVVGDGPTRRRLERTAPPNARFAGRVSDDVLADLYARCRALVYPQEEDFGIVAVEAQAAGRPVIAYGRGGVLDTVVPLEDGANPTGLLFREPTASALAAAVRAFCARHRDFDGGAIRKHAESFAAARFRREISDAARATARRA